MRLELGHRAQVRKKATVEGFTHDWMVFVRGPEHSDIQHFVDKVVFHLHESFPRPKRGQTPCFLRYLCVTTVTVSGVTPKVRNGVGRADRTAHSVLLMLQLLGGGGDGI